MNPDVIACLLVWSLVPLLFEWGYVQLTKRFVFGVSEAALRNGYWAIVMIVGVLSAMRTPRIEDLTLMFAAYVVHTWLAGKVVPRPQAPETVSPEASASATAREGDGGIK